MASAITFGWKEKQLVLDLAFPQEFSFSGPAWPIYGSWVLVFFLDPFDSQVGRFILVPHPAEDDKLGHPRLFLWRHHPGGPSDHFSADSFKIKMS